MCRYIANKQRIHLLTQPPVSRCVYSLLSQVTCNSEWWFIEVQPSWVWETVSQCVQTSFPVCQVWITLHSYLHSLTQSWTCKKKKSNHIVILSDHSGMKLKIYSKIKFKIIYIDGDQIICLNEQCIIEDVRKKIIKIPWNEWMKTEIHRPRGFSKKTIVMKWHEQMGKCIFQNSHWNVLWISSLDDVQFNAHISLLESFAVVGLFIGEHCLSQHPLLFLLPLNIEIDANFLFCQNVTVRFKLFPF